MSSAGRFLAVGVVVVGVVVVLITGCASTGPPGPAVDSRGSSLVVDLPWSGSDLQFFDRAVSVLQQEGESRGADFQGADSEDDRPETSAPTAAIALGATATVAEVVLAATFSDWPAGRTVLVDAGVLEEQAAARLERVVLRRRGESISGYLDVVSRRLPAALSLHWSGWERLGLGEWRDPESQVKVQIPKSGPWIVSRGQISAPVEQSITGGAVGRLAATVGSSGPVEAPVVVWAQGLAIAGIPPQLLPSQLALLIVPAGTERELRAHVVLPFASERDARVAMVISRLVVPAFLREVELERGPGFSILRAGEELYITDVVLTHEQLSELLAEGDIQ